MIGIERNLQMKISVKGQKGHRLDLFNKRDIYYYIAILFILANSLISCGKEESEIIKSTEQENTKQEGIEKKGLIILVEYPDVKHPIQREYAKGRFSELNNYVKEMSYNKVSIVADITEKWYEMPHPVLYYKISSRNLEVDPSKVENLIQDALDAVDKDVDFTKYCFTVIFMSAQMQEYGMIGLCGYPGMLGWETDKVLKTKSGQIVEGGVAIFSYQAHLGTLFHDTAHILGGIQNGKRMVPCLYDHDLQATPGPARESFIKAIINMGFWDPMSCHYYEWNLPPPGISSWTKMRLNWIDQSKIKIVKPGEITEIQLGPLEDNTSNILAVKIPLTETTYYLIENRQHIGFDKNLPGSGVLIMYADDKIAECRHGKAPVKLINADPGIPNLEGAAFDIGKKNSFVDSENGLRIQIMEKIDDSYKISIGW
jgi:M6 family metalloprotease-like protein